VMGFAAHASGSHFMLPRGAALGLGMLALLCFAVEGALVDWSALLLEERTGATPASAALGYSAFSIAMAACRFAGDRIILRVGAVRVM
ncbi:MFS transporter, partial [Acinetobacter baumannii]|nr:MFS transporter [Acinetobacter baumannii]